LAIYTCNCWTMKEAEIILPISLPLSVKPAVEGKPSPEKTADGYELRSRGLARRRLGALDSTYDSNHYN
jgi:hypothetical protein